MLRQTHWMMEVGRSVHECSETVCLDQTCVDRGLELYILDVVPPSDLPGGTPHRTQTTDAIGSGVVCAVNPKPLTLT